ncbi:MAG: cupredoxin domain-containing protein [Acidimicrobiales bacterium]
MIRSHRLRATAVASALALATVLGIAACSSSDSSSGSSASTAGHDASGSDGGLDLSSPVDLTGKTAVEIQVKDNFYEPKVFTVDPGTKVTFKNVGNNAHNVVPVQDGAFPAITTGNLDPGMSATITAPAPGEYRFYCSIHGSPNKGQRGAMIVAGPRR